MRIIQPGYNASSYYDAEAAVQQVAQALLCMLQQQLPRLTLLKLPGLPITDAGAQQLGLLRGLQQVTLAHIPGVPAFNITCLPSSITHFELSGRGIHGDTAPSISPDLQQFTGLLVLELTYCAVPPAVLAGTAAPAAAHVQLYAAANYL